MRFSFFPGLCLLLAGLLLLPALPAQAQEGRGTMVALYRAVMERDLDINRPLEIEDAVIERGHTVIYLDKGTFYPAEHLGGQVYGGVFEGEGRMRFQPAEHWVDTSFVKTVVFDDVEYTGLSGVGEEEEEVDEDEPEVIAPISIRPDLPGARLTLEDDDREPPAPIEMPFDVLVLQFDDGTFAELFPYLIEEMEPVVTDGGSGTQARGRVAFADEDITVTAKKGRDERRADRWWRDRTKYIRAVTWLLEPFNLELDMTRNIIEDRGGLFLAEARMTRDRIDDQRWITYVLNHRWQEEQVLFSHKPLLTDVRQQDVTVVSSQHLPEEYERYDRRQRAHEDSSLVDLLNMKLEVEVQNQGGDGLFFEGRADLALTMRERSSTIFLSLLSGAFSSGAVNPYSMDPGGFNWLDASSQPEAELPPETEFADTGNPLEGDEGGDNSDPNETVSAGEDALTSSADFFSEEMDLEAAYRERPGVRSPSFDPLALPWGRAETKGVRNFDYGLQLYVVSMGENTLLDYVHHRNKVLIKLPREYGPGESVNLTLKYNGPIVDSIFQDMELHGEGFSGNIYYLPEGSAWYPVDDHGDRFSWLMELRYPERMRAAVAGARVQGEEEIVENNTRFVRTTQTFPGPGPALFMGQYLVTERDLYKGRYRVRVMTHPRFKKYARGYANQIGGVLESYRAYFGETIYPEIDVAQTGFLGFAFDDTGPGLIELPGVNFVSKTKLSRLDNLRGPISSLDEELARGVARLWWQERHGARTHRDQWLISALTEYSTALYIGKLLGTSRYEQRVDRWKSVALADKAEGDVLSRGNEAGVEERWRNNYHRGPLLMHCLGDALGDDFYKAVTIWSEMSGTQPMAAEDLRAVLEAVTRKDWTWFFRSYVYGEGDLAELAAAPKRVIDIEARPAARHLTYEAPPDTERVVANYAFEELSDGLMERYYGPGWTRISMEPLPRKGSTLMTACRWSVPMSLLKPVYHCEAVAVYREPGGKNRNFKCAAYLDPDDKQLVELIPGLDRGGACVELPQ